MKFPKLKGKAILAPMSGVTDIAFRELARKYSCSLTYTEFVHSNAILSNNKKTKEMLKISKLEKPSAVQIFGNSEISILQAAKFLENKFDIIDINCGCPSSKITKTGAGSELLKYPDKLQSLIEKLTSKINKPISIKIRSGINDKSINAIKIAKLAEKAGISLITIHARTQIQGYSGKADWDLIKKLKESVNIPVIGNGDISSPESFQEKLEFSKVNYIMIGRASIGNPYLFKQIEDYLKTGKYKEKTKQEQFKEYLKLAIKYNLDFKQIKTQSIYFTKGMEKSKELRLKLTRTNKIEDIKNIYQI